MSSPAETFALHPRLAAGSFPVCDFALCAALLKDDSRWPWLILVPRRAGLRELHDLDEADAVRLTGEIRAASAAVTGLPDVGKVNVGALGNEVPQLHIHVVGRREGDPAWPGPVWGVAGKTAYAPEARDRLVATLRDMLKAG